MDSSVRLKSVRAYCSMTPSSSLRYCVSAMSVVWYCFAGCGAGIALIC